MATIAPIVASRGIDPGSAPSTARDDSIGDALRGVGRTIGNVGADLGAIEQRQIKQQQAIENFQTEQEWNRTKLKIAADYDQAKLGIDPSGKGFAAGQNKAFIDQYDAFLKKVPERLRPEFSQRIATDKQGRDAQAAADEVGQRNAWYEVGVTDTVNAAQTSVASYPEAFEATLADVYRTIDATGLPATKKADLKRTADEMLGRAWFEAQMRADPATAKTLLGVGAGDNGDAAGLIRGFEGFRTNAYADTRSSTGEFDAYRTGYGSDTITKADGTVEKVTASSTVTRADAERDLARRVKEFGATAAGQIGADQWAALPASARAGLTSVAYNYGSLPASVVNAAKSGNVGAIAAAVERLDANPERRKREAAVIRGGAEPAPEVESLTFAERVKLYDQAAAAETQLATQAKAEAKYAYDAEKGGLELAIEQGEVASAQTILDANLDDSDKATLLSKWNTQQAKDADARALVDAYSAGLVTGANPYDTDQRKVVGDAYELLMKSTPDDQKAAVTASFVADMGVVPQPVVSMTRQALNGTTVNDVSRGLELSAKLNDVAPNGLDAVENGKEIIDAASVYNHYVNDRGMSVGEAAQKYIEMNDPKAQEKVSVLKERWKEESKKFSVNDVAAMFDDLRPGSPSLGLTPYQADAINADYMDIAEEMFVEANGDTNLAKKMATEEIKRVYGVSTVSGKDVFGNGAIMKYPPEHFYPMIGDSQAYIRDFAMKDAKSISPTATDVMLVSAPETAIDVRGGNPPRYNLMFKGPDGVWDMAPGMFMVGADDLRSLAQIESEQRRVNLEVMNELRRQQAAMPLYGSGGVSKPIYGGGNYATPPADAAPLSVPGFEQQNARLVDLDQQRRQLLGTDAATPSTAGLDMDALLRQSIEQRASALSSPFGGPQ